MRSNRDLDLSRSRFIRALRHIDEGLKLCRSRVIAGKESAPKWLEGTSEEFVDLTDVPGNDLDYYAFELARLRHVAIAVSKIFGEPHVVLDAVAAFDVAIPHLKEARDPLAHPNDNDLLDDVSWLGALVRLHPDGRVEYLIDVRYQQHEAADALLSALLGYLRSGLLSS